MFHKPTLVNGWTSNRNHHHSSNGSSRSRSRSSGKDGNNSICRTRKRFRYRCVVGACLLGLITILHSVVYGSVSRLVAERRAPAVVLAKVSPPRGPPADASGDQPSMPLPSYLLWDHVTSTIQFPIGARYRTHPDKPTSLELLQGILQSTDGNDHNEEDESAGQGALGPSQQGTLSCFEPDIAATRRLAARVVLERRKLRNRQRRHGNDSNSTSAPVAAGETNNDYNETNTNSHPAVVPPLGLPLLNVGMPKSGSTTLRDFFRRNLRWNVSHHQVDSISNSGSDSSSTATPTYVGEEMARAVRHGLDPFHYLSTPDHPFQAHTQMDYTGRTVNIFPQIQLLDEIHRAHPNATFVLLFRPIRDWVRSTQSWHQYPFRWANAGHGQDLPGLILTPEQREARDGRGEKIVLSEGQLSEWWCHHVRHVRAFVDTYPTHALIELPLDDKDGTTTNLLAQLFDLGGRGVGTAKKAGEDPSTTSPRIWGTSNYNPSKRPATPAIQRPVKYYQMWNHTTHSMPHTTKAGAENGGKKDDDARGAGDDSEQGGRVPTSLEILESVMREDMDVPTCFRPLGNTEEDGTGPTHGAAAPAEEKISFPILHVGLPLVGNDFLKTFFRDCCTVGGATIHVTSKKVKGGGLVGKKMMEAVHAGLPPLSAYFGIGTTAGADDDGGSGSGGNRDVPPAARRPQAFTQLDYTSVLPHTGSSAFERVEDAAQDYSSFPQIQLLDEIHEDVPHATFVLPFRGPTRGGSTPVGNDYLEEWIDVAQNFHNFTERWAAMDDLPGLVLTEEQREARAALRERQRDQPRNYIALPDGDEGGTDATSEPMEKLSDGQLRDWWCRHVRHVRRFVEHYPTHRLLELDLGDREAATARLLRWFPQTNVTCLAELWKETDLL
jgi:hypothetical protein